MLILLHLQLPCQNPNPRKNSTTLASPNTIMGGTLHKDPVTTSKSSNKTNDENNESMPKRIKLRYTHVFGNASDQIKAAETSLAALPLFKRKQFLETLTPLKETYSRKLIERK